MTAHPKDEPVPIAVDGCGGWDSLAEGGVMSYVGLGGSMEPTFQPGDRIRLEQRNRGPVVGDVVAFRWRGQVLTHRVIAVERDSFWARGDATVEREGPVPNADLIGFVSAVCRRGAWLQMDGRWRRRTGLVRNQLMAQIRRLARRAPVVRAGFERHALGNRLVRIGLRGFVERFTGPVTIAEEHAMEMIVAAMVSPRRPLSQDLIDWVHKSTAEQDLHLFLAWADQAGRVGQVLLRVLDLDDGTVAGLVFSHWVRPLLRGMGIGNRLIRAAEEKAREKGLQRLLVLVDEGNVRGMHKSQLGFQPWFERPDSSALLSRVDFDPEREVLFVKDLAQE